jgi:4-amino-4-deoxy-L-arabinose transferase-like glycosyltransferase
VHDMQDAATESPLSGWAAARQGGHAFAFRMTRTALPVGWIVALGLLFFAAVWLSHLAYTSLSPPVDNIEQLTWVRSLEWGYYKHPPLPTWLLWLPVRLFGLSRWTAYVAGAVCTLGALGLMWHLLARLRGTTHAAIALLAALCITYYNGRLDYYNHNTVLMLLSAASATLCWQAFATRQRRWWIGLGMAIGFGALSKYQIAVTAACVVAFALHQRAWRDPVHRLGLLLAALIALLLFAPHVAWLRTHDFGPIRYAVSTSLGAHFGPTTRIAESLHWLVDQVFNRALPALLLLAATSFRALPKRWRSDHADTSSAAAHAQGSGSARAFLLIWGLTPLVFMPLVGIFFGAYLQLHWGTPFLLWAVPAVMELTARERWGQANLRKVLAAFVLIQALLLAVSHLTSPRGPLALRDRHWRTFDSSELAQHIADSARQQLGGPVRIVLGEAALAGSLALKLPELPLVLIDGRFDHSPWVTRGLLRACGALQIGHRSELPSGSMVDPAFPDLAWRVIQPANSAPACPS